MKNLFNEDDFNSLFESSVIDSEGKGPKNNTKTPDVGATKGMQSDFDSMFDDLFSDAEMGDDQSAPVAKQPDTGAAGGSVDPEGDDKGKQGIEPPTKSEWDSLFETGETDDAGSSAEGSVADTELEKKKCHGKGKKLKSDFESLFEGDEDPIDAGSVDDGDNSADFEGEDTESSEFVDLMSDVADFDITGF